MRAACSAASSSSIGLFISCIYCHGLSNHTHTHTQKKERRKKKKKKKEGERRRRGSVLSSKVVAGFWTPLLFPETDLERRFVRQLRKMHGGTLAVQIRKKSAGVIYINQNLCIPTPPLE